MLAAVNEDKRDCSDDDEGDEHEEDDEEYEEGEESEMDEEIISEHGNKQETRNLQTGDQVS